MPEHPTNGVEVEHKYLGLDPSLQGGVGESWRNPGIWGPQGEVGGPGETQASGDTPGSRRWHGGRRHRQ